MLRDLAQIVLAHAPLHVARERAPSTFAELASHDGRELVVWEGASDATIFGDARVNHAFRAWHDATHKRHAFGFTLAGERATCEAQCAELLALWPLASPLAAVIRCEVIGQAEYFATHGAFPLDQIGFARAYLARQNVGL